MIEIKISGKNSAECIEELVGLARQFQNSNLGAESHQETFKFATAGTTIGVDPTSVKSNEVPGMSLAANEDEKPPVRGRGKKSTISLVEETHVVEAANTIASTVVTEAVVTTPKAVTPAVVDAKVYTAEDAKNALSALVEKKGMPSAKAVLTNFGAERISQIPIERLAEFITACAV